MGRFVFKLQTLLDMRKREEDAVLRTLTGLLNRKTSIEERLRRQQIEFMESKQTMRDKMVGVLDTDALRLHAHNSLNVMRAAQTSAIELAGLGNRINHVREQLTSARTKRRAVELLKERRFEEWRRAEERREVADLDELATASFAKKEFAR